MRNLSLAGYNCSGGASCMACSFIHFCFRIYRFLLTTPLQSSFDTEAPFLDLLSSVLDDFALSRIYDKCDVYDFDALNFHSWMEINSGQLIFKYDFSKIFHYNRSCSQQNYIILEVVTRPFSKKCKMSNKD